MSREGFPTHAVQPSDCSRRQFLGGALAAAASGTLLGNSASLAADQTAAEAKPGSFDRKIKLGLVGCGGRGSWIAKLFQQHGGYDLYAVADYFPSGGRPRRRCPGHRPVSGVSRDSPATRG